MEATDPIHLTETFWKAMCANDLGVVNSMVSPDCFLKDGFGSTARGVHGVQAVSAKLAEVSGKISGGAATFQKDVSFRLMRNKKQVRFLTSAKVGWITVSIGFALEYECGIIVKLVLMKNPGKGVFETDDTKEEPQLSPPSQVSNTDDSDDDACNEDLKQREKKNDENHVNESANNAAFQDLSHDCEDESEYIGDFLSKCRSNEDVDNEAIAKHDDDTVSSLTKSLKPPFLTPKPPEIAPTVVVTVVGCQHLQSPLKRLISREVHAYVSVKLSDNPVVQSTQPSKGGLNPVFTSSNKFIFEAPSYGGSVIFTVLDKKSVGDDLVIAEVHVPLASIATTSPSNTSPTALSLPLHLSKQLRRGGKGYHRPSVYGNTAPLEQGQENGKLDVLISKIDIMKWWALEEMKARDAERDRKELEEEEEKRQRQASEAETAAAKKKADKIAKIQASEDNKGISDLLMGSGTGFEPDVLKCIRCSNEFSFFRRKHYCRVCLNAVCSDCSPKEVMHDGQLQRCCEHCFSKQERSSSSDEKKEGEDLPQHYPLAALTCDDEKWERDSDVEMCRICGDEFNFLFRPRHHCRICGRVVCGDCSPTEILISGQNERCCLECNKIYNKDSDAESKATEGECAVS